MATMRANVRPLYVTLELFGLSHPSKYSHVEPVKELAAKPDSRTSRLLPKVKRFYSLFVCCVLTLNVLRYLPSFWVGVDFVPSLTAQRIVILTWFIQNAVTSIVLFVFFENKNHYAKYIAQYTTVVGDQFSKDLKTNPNCRILRRCLLRALVVGWIMVIINTVVIIFLLFSGFAADFSVVLCNPLSYNSIGVKILVIFIILLSSGAWVFPIVLHYTLTTAIELRFQELSDVIEHTALEDCDRPNRFQTLKCVRYKHLQLCKMVETVDQSLSYYIANVYLLNIGNACFLIYDMINKIANGPNLMEIITLSFWLTSSFIITFIISIKSASVHEKTMLLLFNMRVCGVLPLSDNASALLQAHGLSSLIMDINLDGASMQDIAHVNLLVAKLHGPAIGLSVLGIITITKEMILTLAGLFLTYLFLLIQFRI